MGGGATMTAGPTGAIRRYQYGPRTTVTAAAAPAAAAWLWWAIGAALVLAVIGGVTYALLQRRRRDLAVPLVTGIPVAQAKAEIIRRPGLKPVVVQQASTTTRKGYVISSNPPGGQQGRRRVGGDAHGVHRATEGQSALTSCNQSEPDARNTLVNAGFKVTEVTDQNSTAAPNTVVRQNPPAGTAVSPGFHGHAVRLARRVERFPTW